MITARQFVYFTFQLPFIWFFLIYFAHDYFIFHHNLWRYTSVLALFASIWFKKWFSIPLLLYHPCVMSVAYCITDAVLSLSSLSHDMAMDELNFRRRKKDV